MKNTPSVFFLRQRWNSGAQGPGSLLLGTPFPTFFPHILWKFPFKVIQGQVILTLTFGVWFIVRLPHITNHLNLRLSYNNWRIDFKLPVVDKSCDTYKMQTLVFYIHDQGELASFVCHSNHLQTKMCLGMSWCDLCNIHIRPYVLHHQMSWIVF